MLKGEVLLELRDKDRQRKADYQLLNPDIAGMVFV